MGIPINRITVDDETCFKMIRAGLGNKLTGNLRWSVRMNVMPKKYQISKDKQVYTWVSDKVGNECFHATHAEAITYLKILEQLGKLPAFLETKGGEIVYNILPSKPYFSLMHDPGSEKEWQD